MGINPNALRFLAREFKQGNPFGKTAMLGRQGVHVPIKQFERILNVEFKLGLSPEKIKAAHEFGFADELFKLLGAESVESFDYSDYEGANHVHDFNTPIGPKHHDQYSFLIDGGTLEHVFHFPTALKNCMQMLEVGGTYFGVTPANNEMGHGFYQFSPELYFRAFSEQNGFRTDAVYIYEGRENSRWLKVGDPDVIRRRAEIVNCHSTYMLVRATKIAETEVFATPPLQPDYVSAWETGISESDPSPDQRRTLTDEGPKSIARRVGSLLPYNVKRMITMSRVGVQKRVIRTKIHLGMNPDSEIYQLFDPRTD